MTPNPAATDRRRTVCRQRLGVGAACVLCGERRPEALILDRHHVALVGNEPALDVVLCKNCHSVMQERLRGIGLVEWAPVADTWPERHVAVLRGAADFFSALAASQLRDADRMERLVERLDAVCPAWRDWPESRP